jgi:LacI family transcriptional regulator
MPLHLLFMVKPKSLQTRNRDANAAVLGKPAMNKPVDVYEVARRAGVSPATVSRVANQPHLVADATKARVHVVMQALHYVPNVSARALSRGRTHLVGALIPHLGYSVFADYMDAVQRTCADAGYSLVIGVHHFDPRDELRQAQNLTQVGVDGLLLVGFRHAPALFELLAQRNLSYLCTSVFDPNSAHPNVGYDNYQAGVQIAEHLLVLGHTRFAVVTGYTRKNDRMAARLSGFRATLNARGIALPREAVFEGDYSIGEGRRGFDSVYERAAPTALMCGNDVIALGALMAAQARGLEVPRELSLVGFDDIEWTEHFSPALTTMRVPSAAMGREAARSLLARVEGRAAPHAVQIPLQLIERGTTAICTHPL